MARLVAVIRRRCALLLLLAAVVVVVVRRRKAGRPISGFARFCTVVAFGIIVMVVVVLRQRVQVTKQGHETSFPKGRARWQRDSAILEQVPHVVMHAKELSRFVADQLRGRIGRQIR